MEIGDAVEDVGSLRQGDVIDVAWIPAVAGKSADKWETPLGVVILSQTCDVVQVTKRNCLVAPIIEATAAEISAARKGRSPLLLHLPAMNGGNALVADMGCAASIPKDVLRGRQLVSRTAGQDSETGARSLGLRIGRAFNRFPFPDEVYPSFGKLRSKVQSSANGSGAFGAVIDLVEDLRVSADQWIQEGRKLTLYIVVPTRYLIVAEDADPDWRWAVPYVIGLRGSEMIDGMALTRVSELLLKNLQGDRTTLLRLWEEWADAVRRELLAPALDAEVVAFEVTLLTDEEFTLANWKRTESLDLEVLSNSVAPVQGH